MLWDAAERLKRQRERFQRGYQDRRGHQEDDRHAKGPLGGHPSSSPVEARRTGKLNSSKCREATRAGSFHRNNKMPTCSHSPAPIASSSTITLDAISHYGVFPDHTGMPDHNPSNVAVGSVGMDVSIEGLEEEYGEEYDGVADTEGEDDMMEQGGDAENAGGVADSALLIGITDGFGLSDGLAHIKFALKYAPFESADLWSHLAESSNGDWACFTSEITQQYPELQEVTRNKFYKLHKALTNSDTISTSSLGEYYRIFRRFSLSLEKEHGPLPHAISFSSCTSVFLPQKPETFFTVLISTSS
ncbi:hypothetical protein M404DRAFT_30320 [Pisolithus tinctorius Marx 270]|uniref:Retrotransposon gag domain-containing protein n=1 Tax=Pisolithus tinctorius Marx 270 TaxID=870435 RepID=A0A0C3JQ82_PISTI|nr:hypothetical protein M404DRAFT_30320 [Pisolithus tinctorius Marx 270]